jgi:hypothetical protein
MPPRPPVSDVLKNINSVAHVIVKENDLKGEWYGLKSQNLNDMALYEKLKSSWRQIVGPIRTASPCSGAGRRPMPASSCTTSARPS